MQVEFYGLQFDLPAEWVDVTDDRPDGSPPTLAKPDGVGAIQFSIAKYESGADPCATIEHLEELLKDFCSRNALTCEPMAEQIGPMQIVGTTSEVNGDLVSACYISNGRDFVLATYCSGSGPEADRELIDAQRLMRSMRF